MRRSKVFKSYTGWRSISSRVMTLMLAGASLMSMAVPEAVTTTVLRVGSLLAGSASAQAWLTARDSKQGRRRAVRRVVLLRAAKAELRLVILGFPEGGEVLAAFRVAGNLYVVMARLH